MTSRKGRESDNQPVSRPTLLFNLDQFNPRLYSTTASTLAGWINLLSALSSLLQVVIPPSQSPKPSSVQLLPNAQPLPVKSELSRLSLLTELQLNTLLSHSASTSSKPEFKPRVQKDKSKYKKKAADDSAYRDRAAERRTGGPNDFAEAEKLLEVSSLLSSVWL